MIIIIIISVFLECLSIRNMLNCAEQVQIQKYKTQLYKTPKTACVQQICSNIQLSSKDGHKNIFKKKLCSQCLKFCPGCLEFCVHCWCYVSNALEFYIHCLESYVHCVELCLHRFKFASKFEC